MAAAWVSTAAIAASVAAAASLTWPRNRLALHAASAICAASSASGWLLLKPVRLLAAANASLAWATYCDADLVGQIEGHAVLDDGGEVARLVISEVGEGQCLRGVADPCVGLRDGKVCRTSGVARRGRSHQHGEDRVGHAAGFDNGCRGQERRADGIRQGAAFARRRYKGRARRRSV